MSYNYTARQLNKYRSLQKMAIMAIFLCIAGTASAQYCIPTYFNGCSSQDDIDDFTLTGFIPSVISDLNTGCGPNNGYEDRTSAVGPVDLMQGGTYSGSVSTEFSSNEFYSIWIDFNDDFNFDPSENLTGLIGPFGSGSPSSFSITIPLSAPVGPHRMRVKLDYSASVIDPCGQGVSFGETHDYSVNILLAPPCAGTPSITAVSPAGPIASCAGASQTLSLSIPIASGYNFQWQTSVNGGVTWTNITGQTNTSYTFSVTGNADYRIYVTCTNSGLADTSAAVNVSAAPPTYTSVPYFQDFETWQNYCNNHDVPFSASGTNWTNQPATGDSSWRRDDEGNTAGYTTFGTFFPTFLSGAHSARYPSSLTGFQGSEGNMDLYLDCSTQAGNKQLYFYHMNEYSFSFISDSLLVFLSDNGGSSFTQVAGWDTATTWTKRSVPIASNSAQTIIRFKAKVPSFGFDFTDIGVDSVFVAPPCTGTPTAGSIDPAGPVNSCPGKNFVLNNVGGTMAGNLQYDWQQSLDGGITWQAVTGGSGSNTFQFTTDPLFDTISYRLVVTCLGSGLTDTTPSVNIFVASPIYASLPYSEGFENWISYCDVQDVPSFNWLNNPSTLDMSWRRDDEGATANWSGPGFGGYSPVSVEGSHSARIHTSSGFFGPVTTNNFDLFVNCSAPGPKELQFYHINPGGFDQLGVDLSLDGGITFNNLTTIFAGTATQWTLETLPIISTSATTVIRFTSTADFTDDMGLDYVNVLLPCDNTPVAGTVTPVTPCSGQDFNLSLTGSTLAAALTYQWQQSTDGITWTNIAGATNSISIHNITSPVYVRAIVTCSVSGLSDTSNEQLLTLASYYYCYCQSAAQFADDDDIGNVSIDKFPSGANILNNGNAIPLQNNPSAVNGYTNFSSLSPTDLYKDSVYNLIVTHITNSSFFSPGTVGAWIDFNQDGTFDPFAEQVLSGTVDFTTQQLADTFTVPDNAPIGITGMRIVLAPFGFPTPCGSYFNGETEDYLVNINYQPCNGPADAGTARITDTLLCPDFQFTLTDTSYEKLRGGLQYNWQSSTDGINWVDIAGSANEDTLVQTTGSDNMYYRFKLVCTNTNDATYSNVLSVTIKPFFQCYCQSYADGGVADVSDIGVFTIGNFVINSGGGHLNNASAVKAYTDYTGTPFPIWLGLDSTYNVSMLHTMNSGTHQDAKITLFMDFNNNHQYDIPDERVFTGFTTATAPYLNTQVHIPTTAVKNSVTGMRLIVNNDVNPNVPSDEACGLYTSGETEDYLVEFKNVWELGVGSISKGVAEMELYPNPTDGKFAVTCNLPVATDLLELTITDLNGSVISAYSYKQQGKTFRTELDLTNTASGVYFITLKAGGEKLVRKLIVR